MEIGEVIVEDILQEMAYPASFSFETLRSMNSFAARKRYCDEHLTKIGSGSSRIVYSVDDEKVLKIAKNAKGVAQNEHESSFGNDELEIFAKTFESDDDGFWIEMEVARKVKPKEFKKIFGISAKFYECIMFALGYMSGCLYDRGGFSVFANAAQVGQDHIERYCCEENGAPFEGTYNPESGMTEACWDFFYEVTNWMYYYSPSKAEIGDAVRLANLGIVTRKGKETIVIVDFGITEEIFNKHYRRAQW